MTRRRIIISPFILSGGARIVSLMGKAMNLEAVLSL